MKTVLLCLAILGLTAAELPSYFKTCSRDDPNFGKCFVEKGNEVLKTFINGDEKIQTPSIEPVLKHPGAKYEPNDEFFFELKDSDLFGLGSVQLIDAKANFDQKEIEFKMKFTKVVWVGPYEAKALKAKEEVSGNASFIYHDNEYKIHMKYDVKDDHMSVANITGEYVGTPKIDVILENLDKHEAIKTLWEKNKNGFIKGSTDALGILIGKIFGQVFKAATYDELFPPKQ